MLLFVVLTTLSIKISFASRSVSLEDKKFIKNHPKNIILMLNVRKLKKNKVGFHLAEILYRHLGNIHK